MADQTIIKIEDHEARARALFTEQYRNLPEFIKFSDIHAGQIQELEDLLYSFLVNFNLQTAIGVQLDILGKIVGIARNGASDSTYRALIIAKISENTSNGTRNDIINLLQNIGVTGILIFTLYPAGLEIEFERGTGLLTLDEVKQSLIKASLPIELHVRDYNTVTPFGFIQTMGAFGFGTGKF